MLLATTYGKPKTLPTTSPSFAAPTATNGPRETSHGCFQIRIRALRNRPTRLGNWWPLLQGRPSDFIILNFSIGFFGDPIAEVVPEGGATSEFIPLKYLTDLMPVFMEPHPEHPGEIRHTATGRMIKSINGGRRYAA